MTKTRAGSLIFLGAGAYGGILSLQLPLGRWSEPGAGAFPLALSILLVLSGILMFISGRGKAAIDWRGMVKEQWTPFQIVALTAAFISALDWLGYLLASSLYMFALLFWVSRYRPWIALGLAVAIAVGSWYVFGRLFQTPLPKGPFSL